MKRKIYMLLTLLLTLILGLTSIPSLTLAEENTNWEQKSNLLEARTGAASAEVQGIIYIFGGTGNGDHSAVGDKKNTTFAYDTQTDKWTKKRDMPTARSGASAVAVGTKIYVIGGYYGGSALIRTNKVEVYDTQTDTWEVVANLLEARSWTASVLLDNNIYVIGGRNDIPAVVPTVEKYDIQNNKWTKLNNFPAALNGMSAANVNGKIYAIGGDKPNSTFSKIVYEYDIEHDSWIQKGELKTPISVAASAVFKNEIYLMGGVTEGIKQTSTVQIYNPETNQTRVHSNLTFERGQSSGIFANGKLYIIGGVSVGRTIDTVESYALVNTTDPITPVDPDPQPEPQPTGDRAILTVTMTTGLEKEFDLYMSEINAFINWYDAKENGSGPARYGIDKHNNNKGPFSKRVDYVIFKNILSFEVDEYTK